MNTAAILREQIEGSLGARIPVAFSSRERVEPTRIECGLAVLDELLHGGLPAGVLTEFVGRECSGRTTAALAYVAAITRGGSVCAWVDVADALDPEAVAANGVELERLLWVRCGRGQQPLEQAIPDTSASIPSLVGTSVSQTRHVGGGSPHPRSEGRDMPEAVSALLRAHGGLYDRQVRRENKQVGTHGTTKSALPFRSEHREEQIDGGRLPPRRGDNLEITPRCAEPQPRRIASLPSGKCLSVERSASHDLSGVGTSITSKPWQALDHALRATDLLLQGGGFSAIVLDLGSTPPEFAWRIPLATWFRFRAACERTRVSLVLLTQHPCARSAAELVVRMGIGSMEGEGKVMTGIRYTATTERSRFSESNPRVIPIRKPPQSERPGQWLTEATWTSAQ